ncbi:MAG: efflux RND transporter periplasmic adaptor subunit [Candidatus Scalindua sp. AMX11]|nr:MAG: efflux RND transporter periplasmic adaptor subunit [Candidatus Scalindua sp.]NOG85432.1 efflux RND transporter periplasmic adaptor subunit [Planctomycetota bacterium]RZV84024.1 MAG: efflux RND transporter periplasmic adaptor subunit [Candidatus Scalindua sp. SCAELEC01]TDE65692.1 MAG: efflux RND transporter periplasmic adaptor subunit [Candidatus Scalindua sp. AMX11]GJQ58822.1 MAG: hypothetical protein SCALA701_16230 [Candidatus Scalindua sp.]
MKNVIVIRACLIFFILAAIAFFVLKINSFWSRKPEENFSRQNRNNSVKDPRSGRLGKKDKNKEANINVLPVTDRKSFDAVPVEVTYVRKDDIVIYLTNNCALKPAKQVDVVAQISGFVDDIYVDEGDSVELDQLLAKLDEEESLLALKEAKVKKENAQRVYSWSRENFKENIVSRDEVEENKFKFEIASVELERRELEYEYTTIESPITGVIVERSIEEGDKVKKDQIVFKVADFEPILAKIYIPEKDLSKIKKGQMARIVSEFLPGIEFLGKVKEVSPVVDSESGTVKVTIEISDAGGALKPGMFVSVYVIVGQHHDALVIPKKALILGSETEEVFVVREFLVMDADKSELNSLVVGDSVVCTRREPLDKDSPNGIESSVRGKIVAISRHQTKREFSVTIEIIDGSVGENGKFDTVSFYREPDVQICQLKTLLFRIELRAMKTKVTLGFREGNRVEVLSGVKEGERIITVGQNDIGQGANVMIHHEEDDRL